VRLEECRPARTRASVTTSANPNAALESIHLLCPASFIALAYASISARFAAGASCGVPGHQKNVYR